MVIPLVSSASKNDDGSGSQSLPIETGEAGANGNNKRKVQAKVIKQPLDIQPLIRDETNHFDKIEMPLIDLKSKRRLNHISNRDRLERIFKKKKPQISTLVGLRTANIDAMELLSNGIDNGNGDQHNSLKQHRNSLIGKLAPIEGREQIEQIEQVRRSSLLSVVVRPRSSTTTLSKISPELKLPISDSVKATTTIPTTNLNPFDHVNIPKAASSSSLNSHDQFLNPPAIQHSQRLANIGDWLFRDDKRREKSIIYSLEVDKRDLSPRPKLLVDRCKNGLATH